MINHILFYLELIGDFGYKSKSRIWEHSEYFDYQEFTKVFHSHLSNESFENINIERFFVIQMV